MHSMNQAPLCSHALAALLPISSSSCQPVICETFANFISSPSPTRHTINYFLLISQYYLQTSELRHRSFVFSRGEKYPQRAKWIALESSEPGNKSS